jgi:integrase/recombinase XerD
VKKREELQDSIGLEDLKREYERSLLAGDKRIKGPRYALNVFSRYLNETALDPLRIDHHAAQDFQSWLSHQSQRYQAGSILGIIGSLSSFYDYLKKRKLILSNPFTLIDRISTPSRLPGNIPDEKDMDELLLFLRRFTRGKNLRDYKTHYKAHVVSELMYSTGMRISEAAGIKTEDVDLIRGTVVVRDLKTKQIRRAFLNEYARDVLQIYMEEMREKVLWLYNGADDSLLFGSTTNLKTWLSQNLEEACKQMEREKVTPHIFRHSFAYHLLKAGCDIRKIQKFLGHERLDTTSIYAKVDTQTLRNVLDRYHPRGGES